MHQAKTTDQVSNLSASETLCEIKHEVYYANHWNVHTGGIFALLKTEPWRWRATLAGSGQEAEASGTGAGAKAE